MNRVASITGLKVVHNSIFHKKYWSSAEELADEASQHEEYYAGTDSVDDMHVVINF